MEEKIKLLDIDLLVPSKYQPRKTFNDKSIEELATSIKEYGILNPLLVRKQEDNKYEIIAGERRYRAAKMINLKEIPVIIKEVSDNKVAEIALIENLQRENISPIEEAKSYQEILATSNITEQKLSSLIGKSQSFISNKLRLLNLPEEIQQAIVNKEISERHARSLMTVKDIDKQKQLLNKIVNEKLTVKELDSIINNNEITETEIQNAIDDIIKLLNKENKEEEKESDSMNNENIYGPMEVTNNQPEGVMYNQNIPTPPVIEDMNQYQPVANVSMEQPTMPSEANYNAMPNMNNPVSEAYEVNQYQQPAQANPYEAPNNNYQVPVTNTYEMPAQTEQPTVTESVINQPVAVPEANPNIEQYSTSINDAIPNFGENIEATQQMIDPPLFANQETQPAPMADYNIAPAQEYNNGPIEPSSTNRFIQVQNLLNEQGIPFKAYSNETGHCIIIEF